jgi:hypothetical protein
MHQPSNETSERNISKKAKKKPAETRKQTNKPTDLRRTCRRRRQH